MEHEALSSKSGSRSLHHMLILAAWFMFSSAVAGTPGVSPANARSAHQDSETKTIKAAALIAKAEFHSESAPDSSLYYLNLASNAENHNDNQVIQILKLKADAYYYKYDFPKAAEYYKSAAVKEKALNGEASLFYAERLGDAGFCYYRMVDYPNAVNHYKQALTIVETLDNKAEIATNLNNIGLIFNSWGIYDSAIYYHSAALEIDKIIGDPYYISVDYNNIGKIYQAWGKLDQALDYYEESLKYADSAGRENSVAIRLNNIGMIYKQKLEFDKALSYIEKALAIDIRLDNRYRMGVRYHNLGQIHKSMGHAETAHSHFLKALELFIEVQNIEAIALVYRSLGEQHHENGEYADAETYYLRSLSIADSLNLAKLVLENYLSLSTLYEEKGDLREALRYSKVFSSLKDSMFSHNEQKLITEFQTKYETEKKEQEIAMLNIAKEVNSLKLRKANIQRYSLLAAVALLLAIVLLVITKNRYRRRMNSILEEKNRNLEVLNATKDKFFAIISHDLRNPMSGIKNISRSLAENFNLLSKGDAKRMIDSLDHSSQHVNELIQNLLQWARSQNKSYQYEPQPLLINESIQKCIDLNREKASGKNIEINYQPNGTNKVYADENMVQTVLRNLITNAVKFTESGGRVDVETRPGSDALVINVTDTGSGISQADQDKLFRIDKDVRSVGSSNEKGTGLGLIICKEFVELNKGKLMVNSQPGKGSTFSFTLPYADGIEN